MIGTDTLIQLALEIYRKNVKYIMLIGFGIYIPVGFVIELMSTRIDLLSVIQTGYSPVFLPLFFVTGTIMIAILPLETAALTYFTGKKLNDNEDEISPEGIMDAMFGNWSRLFVTALIYYSILFLGIIIIIPAIIFWVIAGFCLNIVVVDRISGVAAIHKSAVIVKYRWWRTFIVLLIIWLAETVFSTLTGLFVAVIGMNFELMLQQAFVIIASAMINTVCMMFKLFGVLYFFNLYYTVKEETIL